METREAEREKFDKKTRRTEHLSESHQLLSPRILKGPTRDFGIGTVSSDPDGGLQHRLQKSKTRRVAPGLRHEGRSDASHSIRGRSAENNVFIFQMPEIPNPKPEPDVNIPRYVHACLDLMYCTCTSPYDRSRKAKVDKTKCEYALHTIQKILFCYVALLSNLQSFDYTKYAVLTFINYRGLDDLIDLGFQLAIWTLKIYATYFLAFKHDMLTSMLRHWDNYEVYIRNDQNKPRGEPSDSPSWTYWLLAITSMIIMPICKTIFQQGVVGWSWENVILANSEETAEMLFVWTPEHVSNSTILNLEEKFGTTLNPTTLTMGTFGILVNTSGYMQQDAMFDFLLQITLIADTQLKLFGNKLTRRISMDGILQLKEDIDYWEHYRKVRQVNTANNNACDGILKTCSLFNLFAFSYFFGLAFQKTEDHTNMAFGAYNMCKILYTYYKARKGSALNEPTRNWLQSLPCDTKRFCVGSVHYSRCVMLHELEKQPLGFGKDMFFISDEFLFMFFGLIGSLSGILVNVITENELKAR